MAAAFNYLDLKMCNCAGCNRNLLGQSEQDLYDSLTDDQKKKLPQVMAGRILDRPYCFDCLAIKEPENKIVLSRRKLAAEFQKEQPRERKSA